MQGFINFARSEMAHTSNIWAQDEESGETDSLPGFAAPSHADTLPLSALNISPCLSFPIRLLRVCRSKLLRVFYKERSAERKNEVGEEGMERYILPVSVSPSYA